MYKSIILAAALAALAVPALADTPWTATPVQASSKTGFVGDTVVWNCGASGCWSASETSDADQMSECRALAQQLGPLSSFSGANETFNADKLAHCNSAAPKR
jgi:hypothetical protein